MWIARPIHPWDHDLAPDEQDTAFANQCLHDVNQAVGSVFARFESVESLDLTVLHPTSHAEIVIGHVARTDFHDTARLAVAMRLKIAGLTYEFGRGGLRPLRRF
jgi:hypothetical protein